MYNLNTEDLDYIQHVFKFINENQILISSLCLTVFVIGIIRHWLNGGWCKSTAKLTGKTVIVTGANRGIGKETARELARRGAKIIMACRNMEAANEAAEEIRNETKGKIIVKYLDLSSFESIHKFVEEILSTEDYIDILINNAALMCPKAKTKDGFDMVFGTNHLGPFLLTNLLLDRIKTSAPARIINVSSDAHMFERMHWDDLNLDKQKTYSPWKAYCQSKLANVLFTMELAEKLKGTEVTTYTVHPGMVRTQFLRHSSEWFQMITEICNMVVGKTPLHGAQTTIYCAVDEELKKSSGKYYKDCCENSPLRKLANKNDAERLWEVSMKMVGLEKSD